MDTILVVATSNTGFRSSSGSANASATISETAISTARAILEAVRDLAISCEVAVEKDLEFGEVQPTVGINLSSK
jgi:hypothetical protein